MTNQKETLTFDPKEVTKKLLVTLSDRARDILVKRYGLGKEVKGKTLEAIGKEYGITRERIRQVESFALNAIRKSTEYKNKQDVFAELKTLMDYHGGIVHENEFLGFIASNQNEKNHIHFLLVLSEAFIKIKEDDEFYHRWTTDRGVADKVHQSLRNLCNKISVNDLILETELVSSFANELSEAIKTFKPENKELARRWLLLSKELGQNPLGEWGLAKSPNIKMRGIRDYAYLVLRENGSPMHFEEVAKQIATLFGKKAHPATCHNELIKDQRFVLVGRGLYALAEWGYTRGVVADVVRAILQTAGPLTKEEIISRVLKERHVKENTILVNLQNPSYFKKDKTGKYFLV